MACSAVKRQLISSAKPKQTRLGRKFEQEMWWYHHRQPYDVHQDEKFVLYNSLDAIVVDDE